MVLQAIFNDAFFSTMGSSSTALFIGSFVSTLVAVDSRHHWFPSLLFLVCGGIATCPKVTDAYLVDLRRVCEEAENKLKSKNVPLPTDKRTPTPPTLPPKRRKSSNIESAFNIEDKNHLRAEITRMLYYAGLPFHLARNPYFVSSYSFAANCNLSGFLPPSYNALRTSLLQQERSHIERLLQPIKSLWSLKGVTLVADGWTDAQRRPLINFMAISEEGPMFLKAIDGSKEYKDKHYMFDLLKDVIKEVGPQNVVQVINDNALVCKAAGLLIEAEFHHIFWTPCVVHTLNLGVKNICAAKNVDVYEMWDSMIEKVKTTIYRHDEMLENKVSSFFEVIHEILNSRWSKSCNPLHCLAHSLNPRYYSDNWLNEVPNRVPPHKDDELSSQRNKCLKRYFPHVNVRTKVYEEFSKFSSCAGDFGSFDSIEDRWALDPKTWWVMHESSTPILQKVALKLLVQPCSSSCCERNWSTYSFIHSLKRNKMDPKRAEDLVFVHSNLRILSRKEEGHKKGETRLWDINGDVHDPFDDSAGVLEMADLSLDEPDLEAMLFLDDGNGGEGNETIRV
ncbi:hypothetical protein GmHk_07G019060 [Glycine max]|nr:hypothetical protein GmHk_07G019060 [Glycine max]